MSQKSKRLDDAARAGWLYYIAGKTQDEIAAQLGVSRQSAQRLVAQAMSAGMVKVRIDHPIADCMTLAAELRARFGLNYCEVVPSDPTTESTTLGIAEATADVIESWLSRPDPIIMAVGTGRTLRAAIGCLPHLDCAQHRIVSLTGNISPDGSTAFYNVVFSLAELVTARTFPMPLPVVATSAAERELLQRQPMVKATLALAAKADVAILGIGELDDSAPLRADGFVTSDEIRAVRDAGGVGEMVGWVFDWEGRLIRGLLNDRTASAPLPDPQRTEVIASAMGPRKLPAIRAAVTGGLVTGLVTDEDTARALLSP